MINGFQIYNFVKNIISLGYKVPASLFNDTAYK